MKTKVIIPLAIIFAALVALMPGTAKWAYEYRQGSEWKYETLTASMSFPILKTEAQIEREKAEKAASLIPYYRLSSNIFAENLGKAKALDLSQWPGLQPALLSSLALVYDKGIVSEAITSSPTIYVQKGKRAEKVPSTEVFSLPEARNAVLFNTISELPQYPVDSIFRAYGVFDLVMPDLNLDEELTNLVNEQGGTQIATTAGYVTSGTVIVTQGEMVTAEIAQILDSYKMEYQKQSRAAGGVLPLLGNALILLLILVCLYFAIYYSNPTVFNDWNRYMFLLTVFTIMAVSELLIIRFAPDYIFLFPFPVGAIFLASFFKTRLIYPVYLVSLFPLLIFAEGGASLFLLFVASATVTLYVFRFFSKGVKQFLAALVNFLVLALGFLALKMGGIVNYDTYWTLAMLFGASLLQVLCYPLVYIMERVFNLVSTSRLLELEDMSNFLLKDLQQNAPGTFQHSLQVMNLASAAARAIGADEALVKAGALYHDIGKTMNPLCYVENESIGSELAKYHEGLTPLQSAQAIIKHVTDGMELARMHKLPAPVSDFILSHHGTNCVTYFYDKFLKEGGDPAMKPEFCYPGKKPQTKEQAILMICGSLEAAARALKDHSPEAVSRLVEKIVQFKIDDAQLEEADLSLKELATIKGVLKSYISQINHERIKYPERKKNR